MKDGFTKAILVMFLAAGCSSGPARPTPYRDLGWAQVSAAQAEAECYAEINRPGGIPSMYLCMRAKGWQER